MSRAELDNLLSIDVANLNKWGYFSGYSEGAITWSHKNSSNQNIVSLSVNVVSEPNMRLNYITTDRFSGERKEFDYKIQLVSTTCQFGGGRWWFRCPLVVNGKLCGRLARIVYKESEYFGCRVCQNLVYSIQNENPVYRHGFFRVLTEKLKSEEILKTIHIPYYRGKPTRKMKQYLKYLHNTQRVLAAWEDIDERLSK